MGRLKYFSCGSSSMNKVREALNYLSGHCKQFGVAGVLGMCLTGVGGWAGRHYSRIKAGDSRVCLRVSSHIYFTIERQQRAVEGAHYLASNTPPGEVFTPEKDRVLITANVS